MSVRRVIPDLHGDPAASRDFYEGVIGLDVAMDLDWIVTFCSTSNATAQITVMREDATAPVAPDVTIEVDDVDVVHARAREHGCEVVHPLTNEPWGVRRFFIKDPNGAVVNVMQHDR